MWELVNNVSLLLAGLRLSTDERIGRGRASHRMGAYMGIRLCEAEL